MFLDKLKGKLREELPGLKAQELMAPEIRPFLATPGKPVPAAVLILLFQRDEEWFTMFIQRNDYDGPHGGQISLPGGRMEQYDISLQQTALRETQEELGILSDSIRILGKLTPLHIPASNYMVHPFVGIYTGIPSWQPNGAEVKYVIEARLSQLLDKKNTKIKKFLSGMKEWDAPFYDVNGEAIWGATAMIISEFLEVVRSIEF